MVEVPAYEVDVISTLGAGDVFHGALLAGLVRAWAAGCLGLRRRSRGALVPWPRWSLAIPTWTELRGSWLRPRRASMTSTREERPMGLTSWLGPAGP